MLKYFNVKSQAGYCFEVGSMNKDIIRKVKAAGNDSITTKIPKTLDNEISKPIAVLTNQIHTD